MRCTQLIIWSGVVGAAICSAATHATVFELLEQHRSIDSDAANSTCADKDSDNLATLDLAPFDFNVSALVVCGDGLSISESNQVSTITTELFDAVSTSSAALDNNIDATSSCTAASYYEVTFRVERSARMTVAGAMSAVLDDVSCGESFASLRLTYEDGTDVFDTVVLGDVDRQDIDLSTSSNLQPGIYMLLVTNYCSLQREDTGVCTAAATFDLEMNGSLLGDIDLDGMVGATDLIGLLSVWGMCTDPATCAYDLDMNNTIDVIDLITLLGNWG